MSDRGSSIELCRVLWLQLACIIPFCFLLCHFPVDYNANTQHTSALWNLSGHQMLEECHGNSMCGDKISTTMVLYMWLTKRSGCKIAMAFARNCTKSLSKLAPMTSKKELSYAKTQRVQMILMSVQSNTFVGSCRLCFCCSGLPYTVHMFMIFCTAECT